MNRVETIYHGLALTNLYLHACLDYIGYIYQCFTDRQHNRSSDIVALLAAFICGTLLGALLWPVCMLLFGHVAGVLISAFIAGYAGVTIKSKFTW